MIECDATTLWPRVALLYINSSASPEDVDVFFKQLDEIYNRRQKFCIIAKLADQNSASPAQRKEINRRFAILDPKAKDIQLCAAVLVRSTLVRGLFSALHWIKPPATPQKAFRQLADCIPWVNESLASADLGTLSADDVRKIDLVFYEFEKLDRGGVEVRSSF